MIPLSLMFPERLNPKNGLSINFTNQILECVVEVFLTKPKKHEAMMFMGYPIDIMR